MRRCQTGRDPPSQRCHINPGYMRRWIDKPSSAQPKRTGSGSLSNVTHQHERAGRVIPHSNYLLPPSPRLGSVNQHFLLVDLLWTTGCPTRPGVPVLLSSRTSEIAGLRTLSFVTPCRSWRIQTNRRREGADLKSAWIQVDPEVLSGSHRTWWKIIFRVVSSRTRCDCVFCTGTLTLVDICISFWACWSLTQEVFLLSID